MISFAAKSFRQDDLAFTSASKSDESATATTFAAATATIITPAATTKYRSDVSLPTTYDGSVIRFRCSCRCGMGPVAARDQADTASGTFSCRQVGTGGAASTHTDRRQWRPVGAQLGRGPRKDRVGYGELKVSLLSQVSYESPLGADTPASLF